MNHTCELPDVEAFLTAADESDDWRAEFWRCPDCRQWWTADWHARFEPCASCGHEREAPGWLRSAPLTEGPDDPRPKSPPPVRFALPRVTVNRGGISYGPLSQPPGAGGIRG